MLQGLAALTGAQLLAPEAAASPSVQLLDPQELQKRERPTLHQDVINGKTVQYLDEGKPGDPAILYFHGWGGGFDGVWPREYPLVDAGYRLIVPNRPGYGATSLDHGRTSRSAARMAQSLLRKLRIRTVVVVGTSGGGPAALAFADRFVSETKALILQCAVSHRWSEYKYVPTIYWAKYKQASLHSESGRRKFYREMGKGLNLSLLEEHMFGGPPKKVENVDSAYQVFTAQLYKTLDPRRDVQGRENDVVGVFLDGQHYFGKRDVKCPTLVIHDDEDKFVSKWHAEHAVDYIDQTRRVSVTAGHMIWLGLDAPRMHKERLAFLNSHHPRALAGR